MIPPFDEHGYLPPGIHPATLDEIEARFGNESELRRVQVESLRWMVSLAWCAGVNRIVVNGSFVTDKWEPNDVDCVMLIEPGFPRDSEAEAGLLAGLPFINMEFVDLEAFRQFTERIFGTDRNLKTEGPDRGDAMIENQHQFENTQAKLLELQQLYERKRTEAGDAHVRELTLRSLKHRINRFTEELARYTSHLLPMPDH